ncbi:MAG: hypothetical protein VBE63_08050 [Lamprobacter sp.]|uniref:hypothetical protein n=1 Tax=Lamprobacter sp. TaxID=3100796 RepID=UPI002B25C4C9|nr:hypothetical protein [Lamprobacter sp.]MEA3639881.1 hypothetical protein [Lamprobacter sp.]
MMPHSTPSRQPHARISLIGLLGSLLLALPALTAAAVPATPLMTLYKFNGPLEMPFYSIGANGPGSPAGSLAQGTSVIPCLVVRNGRALTDAKGTPYVGFEVVVDPSKHNGQAATRKFEQIFAERASLKVENHHCDSSVRYVLNVRDLYVLKKPPFFDPPGKGDPAAAERAGKTELDKIIRVFHNSPECAAVDRDAIGRRARLASAWNRFIAKHDGRWDATTLARAKHLDYSMRTAIFEGHLDRGCTAYGACERNVVVLSIRNRGVGQCLKRQGCKFPGDFQGISSDVGQYNIWDAYLTQISGLTSCYLRTDLANQGDYPLYQGIYSQSVGDAETILYGGTAALTTLFPGNSLNDLTELRHYYHPPAMGKCFPQHQRVEYMSGAVAEKGSDHVLIANTRIQVDDRVGSGYRFKAFRFDQEGPIDAVRVEDNYPGFIVDGRKVSLGGGGGCTPYGVSSGCRFSNIGRYRRTPSWLTAGKPLALNCRIQDRGASCSGSGREHSVTVGGACDIDMMPVSGVH